MGLQTSLEKQRQCCASKLPTLYLMSSRIPPVSTPQIVSNFVPIHLLMGPYNDLFFHGGLKSWLVIIQLLRLVKLYFGFKCFPPTVFHAVFCLLLILGLHCTVSFLNVTKHWVAVVLIYYDVFINLILKVLNVP